MDHPHTATTRRTCLRAVRTTRVIALSASSHTRASSSWGEESGKQYAAGDACEERTRHEDRARLEGKMVPTAVRDRSPQGADVANGKNTDEHQEEVGRCCRAPGGV